MRTILDILYRMDRLIDELRKKDKVYGDMWQNFADAEKEKVTKRLIQVVVSDLKFENCGYNPERVDEDLFIVQKDGNCLLLKDKESGLVTRYILTDCDSEIDYILKYPKTVGITYKRHYYFQD